jgi:hypothetical protein
MASCYCLLVLIWALHDIARRSSPDIALNTTSWVSSCLNLSLELLGCQGRLRILTLVHRSIVLARASCTSSTRARNSTSERTTPASAVGCACVISKSGLVPSSTRTGIPCAFHRIPLLAQRPDRTRSGGAVWVGLQPLESYLIGNHPSQPVFLSPNGTSRTQKNVQTLDECR